MAADFYAALRRPERNAESVNPLADHCARFEKSGEAGEYLTQMHLQQQHLRIRPLQSLNKGKVE